MISKKDYIKALKRELAQIVIERRDLLNASKDIRRELNGLKVFAKQEKSE